MRTVQKNLKDYQLTNYSTNNLLNIKKKMKKLYLDYMYNLADNKFIYNKIMINLVILY